MASGANSRSNGAAGKIAYINARLIDPASELDAPGALLTEGSKIAAMGADLFAGPNSEGPPTDAEIVDCGGKCLAPGLVDMRVQLREPGDEHKETIASASEAALAGGVTAMACLPNTDPVIDDEAVVEFVARRAREVKGAKVFCYAAATRGLEGSELTEIGLLAATGAVAFTDGERAIANAQVMRRALSYAKTFDALIVQHPEEPELAGGDMNAGETAMRLGLKGIPQVAEIIMLERDMRLVATTGGRYHAAHVSTAGGVEVIRRAKARGLPVTCDTAPHYFLLNELAIGDYRTFAKVSPPLRNEEDRLAIVSGLKDGTIDAIASDHAPHDQDSKRVPFAQAETGVIGLETLLTISLNLVHKGEMTLLDVLRKLTSAPANILRLPLGRLAVGEAADLILFDPDRPWHIREEDFRSKSKNSPFDGLPAQGRALRTVVAGRTLFDLDAGGK